jgi:hypothetical protein
VTFLIFVAVFVALACLGVPLLALGLAAVLRSSRPESPRPRDARASPETLLHRAAPRV